MAGEGWLRWSRAWFDERTIESVIEPLVADWQHEAATGASPRLRTQLRWQLAIARSFIVCFVDHARRPSPSGVLLRAWLIGAVFAALGALLLPAIFQVRNVPLDSLWLTGLAISLPLAAVPLLILVTQVCDLSPPAARWLAIRTALVATLVMMPLAGWMVSSTCGCPGPHISRCSS